MSTPNLDTLSSLRRMRFLEALDEAVAEEMRRDDHVFVMGTNPPGKLMHEFGPERVRRMPISEALFTGLAVGASCGVMRPVVMWRNATFGFVAFDQLANQAAKLRYMSGGQRAFPIVFRCHGGSGLRMAAQHSQSPYAIYAQLPGLKVIAPSNAADALGLLKTAIRDDNPVVSFEASALDDREGEVPGGDHLVPLGEAAVITSGEDVSLVSVGAALTAAEGAARALAEDGVSVELIDLRSIVPMDHQTIRESAAKTGRVVVVDEAPAACSVAAEITAVICEDPSTFAALRAPVRRVCGAATPVPFAPVLEDAVRPNADSVLAAVRDVLE